MLKEAFLESLKDSKVTDEEIVEKYVQFGTPIIFKEDEHLYYSLKRDVANYFSASIDSVHVVGSSKLGFSIAPQKFLVDMHDDSDIDVAIIDSNLYDSLWEQLFEFNINLQVRNEREQRNYSKFLSYFFRGWLRPDLFPAKFNGTQAWFDFFRSISYKQYDGRKINGAVYRNEYFFKQYHISNIHTLRERIKHE